MHPVNDLATTIQAFCYLFIIIILICNAWLAFGITLFSHFPRAPDTVLCRAIEQPVILSFFYHFNFKLHFLPLNTPKMLNKEIQYSIVILIDWSLLSSAEFEKYLKTPRPQQAQGKNRNMRSLLGFVRSCGDSWERHFQPRALNEQFWSGLDWPNLTACQLISGLTKSVLYLPCHSLSVVVGKLMDQFTSPPSQLQ